MTREDSAGNAGARSFVRIEPTVFFVEKHGALKQGVDVVVENSGATVVCRLAVMLEGKTDEHDLGMVGAGETTQRIFVPDIREEKPVTFRLLVEGKAADEQKIQWQPQRHWTVYLVQFAHFDPGYTDLPSNVLDEYLGFLDDIVAWCEQTADWPDEAKFRYVVEQAWIARHYVRHRPPEMIERFVRCCRAGQIELTASFANMTSDLLGVEETARLLYPAFEFKRRYGIPIRVAEHNDVPGMSWSLATAFVEAGVKYFMPGIPGYFGARYVGEERAAPHANFDDALVQPHDCPVAFRWQAQNARSEAREGGEVLVYLHRQGCGGNIDSNLSALAGELTKAAAEGYPYDAFLYRLTGGGRDNSPPMFDYVETVKAWNARWAYPRLVMATDLMFFEAFEKELAMHAPLPTYRGHWPDTDYALGSTSTAENLGVNRNAKAMLIAGERMATIAAAVAAHTYPGERIKEAYISTLQFDDHAWGLDTELGWGYDAHGHEKALYAHRAAAFAEDILTKSVHRIADHVAIKDEGRHIVVFNALEYARTDVVEVPFTPLRACTMLTRRIEPPAGDPRAPYWTYATAVGRLTYGLPFEWIGEGEKMTGGLELVDVQTGTIVPHQIVRVPDASFPMRFSAERHNRAEFSPRESYLLQFVAHEVPAVGYRAYAVVAREGASAPGQEVRAASATIENEFYRVTLDERSGAVASIYDKELGRELIDAAAGFGVNEVFARVAASGVVERLRDVTITPMRRGPVAVSLLVTGTLPGMPQVSAEIMLHRGIKRVDFLNRGLKDAAGGRGYFVAFPFAVGRPRFRFEVGPNVVRPIEDQFPGTMTEYYAAQNYVRVDDGGGNWGITWSAREAPIVQLGGNWPEYISPAHHGVRPHGFDHDFLTDPAQFTKGHLFSLFAYTNYLTNFAVQQPGVIRTSYSFTSTRGDGTGGAARRFGWGFCGPMVHSVIPGPQQGPLPAAHSFCTVDKANVALTTIKRADDDQGLIVRLVETEGVETDVTVDVPFAAFTKAVETNLVEEGARPLPCNGTRFTVHLAPWRVATVRLAR
ncbi:MAG: hypothetical protein JW889_01075 [Verrucomicrobia bacterium]|nr:hypothetical protein [Verrucomicrobiota bacterium]